MNNHQGKNPLSIVYSSSRWAISMCSFCLCTCLIPSFSAWLHPKDLSSLKRHEIEAFLADEGKKRNADLREGYRIALDPNDWLANNEKRRQTAAQQELEAQEQVDQLDSETEEVGDARKGKGPKKRKRDSDDELIKEKKTTKSKKDSTESKKKTTGGKSRKNGRSKSVVESEDDAQADGDDAGPSKKASSPPSKKAKRDKDDEPDDGEQLFTSLFSYVALFLSFKFVRFCLTLVSDVFHSEK